MSDDIIARAEAVLSPDARMDAYYYSFRNTGLAVIDSILSAVATAGKAYHHTEEWGEAGTWDDKPTHESRIQSAADESATLVRELVAELKTTRAQLAAVEALAEGWRYKGEFGWGAWQEGRGPDQEGYVLDSAAAEVRAVIERARGEAEGV